MNRYVLIEPVYQQVFTVIKQVLDTEDVNLPLPPEGGGFWIDITGNTTAQVGWFARFMTFEWVITEPTYEDYVTLTTSRMQERFDKSAHWLTFNPLQYKVDIGVATPADEAALLAYKQYFVAVSEVKSQPGYPSTINWPVAPF